MCSVTYVGISIKNYFTYLGISTRKNDLNSYVENITRARCGFLKSPKRVESSTQEHAQTSHHQTVKSSRKNRPGGALQLRLRQYSERPSGPSTNVFGFNTIISMPSTHRHLAVIHTSSAHLPYLLNMQKP